MTTSITEIADLAQLALSDVDESTWSQETIEAWVLEGIRDYGSHFQLTQLTNITLAAGVHAYDLPENTEAITLVEYPAGQDPPEYLSRLSRRDPRFWSSDDYYDLEHPRQTGITSPTLYLSASPAAGELAQVTYTGPYHDQTIAPTDTTVYVPDNHIPLVVAFVQWKAAVERLNLELQLQGPDRSDRDPNVILDMGRAATAARDTYDKAIQAAKRSLSETRFTRRWEMDSHDRIY